MKGYRTGLLWGMVLVVSTGLLSGVARAATPATPASGASNTEGFNVLISPLPTKLVTPPGHTVTADLRMKNQGTQPESIKVSLMKFGASGDNGQPDISDLTSKDAYGKWVHFSPDHFVAQPNIWNTVKMTIDVPPDAALGYYLAVTFSRSTQAGVSDATNLRGAVASLVLLEVKTPNEKRQVQLADFTSSHGLYEYLPADFKIKVHNNGNIFIAPAGNIFIQHRGKTIQTLTFNEAGGNVLPGSNRIFSESWKDGFPVFKDKIVDGKPVTDKHGLPKRDLKWDVGQASKLRLGKYTAKLLVVYDNGQQDVPIEATVSFWVFPWKVALVLLVVLIIIGLGLFGAGRSFVRRIRRGNAKK